MQLGGRCPPRLGSQPPMGPGRQALSPLIFTFQRDGFQVPERDTLGCKAARRLMYTYIAKRQRKIHKDKYSKGRVVAVGEVSPLFAPGMQTCLS